MRYDEHCLLVNRINGQRRQSVWHVSLSCARLLSLEWMKFSSHEPSSRCEWVWKRWCRHPLFCASSYLCGTVPIKINLRFMNYYSCRMGLWVRRMCACVCIDIMNSKVPTDNMNTCNLKYAMWIVCWHSAIRAYSCSCYMALIFSSSFLFSYYELVDLCRRHRHRHLCEPCDDKWTAHMCMCQNENETVLRGFWMTWKDRSFLSVRNTHVRTYARMHA